MLTTARLNKGLSLEAAALQIGVARTTLVRAERGERIHPAKAKLIADFFGLEVSDFYPVEPPNNTSMVA
jgi:transcriptional regulator with XRE-family HTH domain